MSAQHTPGPWIWGPNARLYADPYIPECQRICNVSLNKTTALCWDEKDAKLIAAAPDLLAALQMVNRIWSHDQTANLDPESPVAIVRAAINKATGETA
jgi:hypothetical protein